MSFARQEASQQDFAEYLNRCAGQKHTAVSPILPHASAPGSSSWPGSSATGRLLTVPCTAATVAIRCIETLR